jgi:hypothetical protein
LKKSIRQLADLFSGPINPEKQKFAISLFFEDPRKIEKIEDFYFSGPINSSTNQLINQSTHQPINSLTN